MNAAFIYNTFFFEINERFISLYDYFVEKDNTLSDLDHIFNKPNIWNNLGQNFRYSLVNRTFIYKLSEQHSSDDYEKAFFQSFMTLEFILDLFWFAKDCSCQINLVAGYLDKATVTLTSGNEARYTASGNKIHVTFDIGDFALIDQIAQLVSILNQKSKARHVETIQSEGNLSFHDRRVDYDQIEKPSKVLLFLKNARTTPILPQKISNYILILECLFSHNNQTEIQHRICERVAFYMHNEFQQRISLYKFIKACYGIRSKFVHGDKVSSNIKIEKGVSLLIQDVSIQLDSIVRQILIKVFLNDSEHFFDEENIEEWLNKLVFGYDFFQTPHSAIE